MCQRFTILAAIVLLMGASTAFAQCGCSAPAVYAPVATSYASYYAAPAVAYTPTTYTSYYAPAVPVYTPTPYVSYYAPTVAYAAYAPTPYVSYYAGPTAYATYYAPSVTYAPAAVPYAVVGSSIYGTPRVYVPGQPVRNTLKAVFP